MERVQYTIRGVPEFLDANVRMFAKKESKSINQVLLDALSAGLGYFRKPQRNDSLVALAGSWEEYPESEKAFAEMDRIDEELWK